jgi:hypothetical protein
MTKLNSRTLLRTSTTKIATSVIAVTCSTLLIALGVATMIGGTNHILYTTVSAQLVDMEGLKEDLRAGIAEELKGGVNQNQIDQSAPATSPDGLTLSLDRAHFIPLSPLSDSPGNQVKMLLGYSVQNSTALVDDKVNAVMEVYAANQTLLRTSSLAEPISLADSEGSIQLATTFGDPTLQNVTVKALLTDGQKIFPLSDPIEESIGLGEIIAEQTLSELE